MGAAKQLGDTQEEVSATHRVSKSPAVDQALDEALERSAVAREPERSVLWWKAAAL